MLDEEPVHRDVRCVHDEAGLALVARPTGAGSVIGRQSHRLSPMTSLVDRDAARGDTRGGASYPTGEIVESRRVSGVRLRAAGAADFQERVRIVRSGLRSGAATLTPSTSAIVNAGVPGRAPAWPAQGPSPPYRCS